MRISISLPEDLREKLEEISKESGHRSLASIIREAVEKFGKEKSK